MSSNFTPLDPDEGPTVWVEQDEANKYTYRIIIGTDPDDPMDTYELSDGEIERLYNFTQS